MSITHVQTNSNKISEIHLFVKVLWILAWHSTTQICCMKKINWTYSYVMCLRWAWHLLQNEAIKYWHKQLLIHVVSIVKEDGTHLLTTKKPMWNKHSFITLLELDLWKLKQKPIFKLTAKAFFFLSMWSLFSLYHNQRLTRLIRCVEAKYQKTTSKCSWRLEAYLHSMLQPPQLPLAHHRDEDSKAPQHEVLESKTAPDHQEILATHFHPPIKI